MVRRGPVGGESVFYARVEQRWVTSSSLGWLARESRATPDLPVLARWMAFLEEPTARTLFHGVSRLLPYETLSITGDAATLSLEVPALGPPPPMGTLEELALELRARVSAALSRALEGTSRAGVFVGGLDSCGLSAIALSLGAPVTLVTCTHSNGDPDEPYVDLLAKQCGVRPVKLDVSAGADLIDSLLLVDGVPCPSPGGYWDVAAARALRELGADRVITGFAGDDVFGGHPSMLGTRVLPRRPLRAIHEALRLQTPDGETARYRLVEFLIRPNLRELVPSRVRASRQRAHLARRFSWCRPAFLAHLEDAGVAEERRYHVPRSDEELFRFFVTSVSLANAVDLRTLLEHATKLPRLDPLLDVDLVRFASSLPYEVLNCDGVHRGLYRRALRGLVPEQVRTRLGKADMNGDMFVQFKRELETPRWRERFSVPRLAALDWVDPRAFRARMEDLRTVDDVIATWPFLAADAFLEAHAR